MYISTSCAHTIRDVRKKNVIFGFFSLFSLIYSCYNFIWGQNSFYQLIYISELIIGYFMMLIVFNNQTLAMDETKYVLTMSYLINETQRVNFQQTDQELEDMIKDQCRERCSNWEYFYTCIKMSFHNFCCESKDFLYLLISAGVVTSYFFEQQFQSQQNIYQVAILCFITFFDFLLVSLGIIIEMPRRIRQYYKMRALNRRASRLQFQDMQRQVQTLENLEAQDSFLQDLLQIDLMEQQYQLQEKRQDVVQQHQVNAEDEQVQCQICFEDMNENTNIKQLQCHPSHIFHSVCITNWFEKKRKENLVPSCPICRAPYNL